MTSPSYRYPIADWTPVGCSCTSMPPSHFAMRLYRNAPRASEDEPENSVEYRRQQAEKHSDGACKGVLTALIRNHGSRQANEKEKRQEQQAQRRVQCPHDFRN